MIKFCDHITEKVCYNLALDDTFISPANKLTNACTHSHSVEIHLLMVKGIFDLVPSVTARSLYVFPKAGKSLKKKVGR